MNLFKKTLCVLIAALSMQLFLNGASSLPRADHANASFTPSVVYRAVNAFRVSVDRVDIREFKATWQWTWVQMDIYDEEVPITVDILISHFRRPSRVLYMLPGGGSNFKSSFFTPRQKNLAHFCRKSGYMVVGISPREDNVPEGMSHDVMAEWGLEKHKKDIRKIIKVIQSVVRKKYDILGHSYGAALALDYAGTYSGLLRKIIVVDIDFVDPVAEPQLAGLQALCAGAYGDLVDQGVYGDPFITEFKVLAAMAAAYPQMDSGESRDVLGLPGNFTLEGLLYFGAIYTGAMPGPVSHITGAPGDWGLTGTLAGQYNFDLDPVNDTYSFTYSRLEVVVDALNKCNSGLIPMALHRDFTEAASYAGPYQINWAGIGEKVTWINMQLGYNEKTYGAELIKQAGNDNVNVVIVPGYAHGDVLWSDTAEDGVWPLLLK